MWSVITVLEVASPDLEAVVTATHQAADRFMAHDRSCAAFEVHRDLYSDRVALVQRYRNSGDHAPHDNSPMWRELEHLMAGLTITSRTTVTSSTRPAAPTEEPT